MAKSENKIVIPPITEKSVVLTIVGESDLILNKMNKRTIEMLTDERNDKGKAIREQNQWEDIITAVHWRDPLPKNIEYSEETLKDLLTNNAPCISAFGLQKSLCQAVTRNEIDKYSTKFDASVSVTAPNNLIPIRFSEHFVDEKLMSPQRGRPVLVRLNRFTGWSADVMIRYLDGGAYRLEQIIQIVQLAGFGLGIGSGRSSGYGRYSVSQEAEARL